jgi:hypothetical protein
VRIFFQEVVLRPQIMFASPANERDLAPGFFKALSASTGC